MSDPKNVSPEATKGGSIGFAGISLWKVVTVVMSGDDRCLVVRLCSGTSQCCCVTDCTGDCVCC